MFEIVPLLKYLVPFFPAVSSSVVIMDDFHDLKIPFLHQVNAQLNLFLHAYSSSICGVNEIPRCYFWPKTEGPLWGPTARGWWKQSHQKNLKILFCFGIFGILWVIKLGWYLSMFSEIGHALPLTKRPCIILTLKWSLLSTNSGCVTYLLKYCSMFCLSVSVSHSRI